MNRLPPPFRWLTLAALADWLIARTLTRLAIFMPKSPPIVAAYQATAFLGQVAMAGVGLLALAGAGWIVWRAWNTRRFGLLMAWAGLVALSLAFLVTPAAGWLAVLYLSLAIAVMAINAGAVWGGSGTARAKLAWSLPALALLSGALFQISHHLYTALRWPGPPPFASAVFNLGELFVALSPAALWWAHGRGASRAAWLAGSLPALAFAAARLADPATTGIIAVWSTGLTLYLPWPVYAVGLWLTGATVIAALRRGEAAGWAILLLAAGGYAPQLSTQLFAGLIGLWWLGQPATAPEIQFSLRRRTWITSSESSA